MPKNKYKVVCFDLDGTLIDGLDYIYDHLWKYFKIDHGAKGAPVHRHLQGEITYKELVDEDVRLLREAGVTRSRLLESFARLKPMQGALETLDALKRAGYKIGLISGSIDIILDHVFPHHRNHFDHVYINQYFFDDAGQITHATPTRYDFEHKASGLDAIAAAEGVDTRDCVFVGDNDNDVAIAERAGFTIAFDCKSPMLAERAHVVIKEKDLRHILPYIL